MPGARDSRGRPPSKAPKPSTARPPRQRAPNAVTGATVDTTAAPGFALGDALLRAFETNDRINQYLLAALDDEVWTAPPPGGKGRTISAIFAHMHNVRVMWLKAAKATTVPAQLDRHTVTCAAAAAALAESRAALAAVLAAAIAGDGRVRGFRPDVAGFFAYLVAHDAHHRGQITMLARQAGRPVSQQTMFGMWEWNSRARDASA